MIKKYPTTKLPLLSPQSSNRKCLARGEEPMLWKAYRRLTEIKLPRFRGGTAHALSVVKKPRDEYKSEALPHLKILHCNCFEHSMQQSNHNILANEKNVGTEDQAKWVRRAFHDYRSNERSQIPLQSLSVRWQRKRKVLGYDEKTLAEILSVFGELLEIRLRSVNSALVVFKDISTACHVMQEPYLGHVGNKLHFKWWHGAMAYRSFTVRKKQIKARIDPFLSILM